MSHYRFGLVFLTVAALMLPGCDEDSNPSTAANGNMSFDPSSITGSISLRVLDAYTQVPLKDVTVEIAGEPSIKTDSLGAAFFPGLTVGSYTALLQKTGYEPVYARMSVDLDSHGGDFPVPRKSSVTCFLSRRGVTVSGSVYYQETSGKIAASGASVELTFTGSGTTVSYFSDPVRTASTSTSGKFFFYDLPENTTFSIHAKPFTAGDRRYVRTSPTQVYGQSAGDTVIAPPIILSIDSDVSFMDLANNFSSLGEKSKATISFSTPIDTATTGVSGIILLYQSRAIMFEKSWSKDLTQLSIVPFGGGWSEGAAYTLQLNLKNFAGARLQRSFYLSVAGTATLGPILNIKAKPSGAYDTITTINYNTLSLSLSWPRLKAATWYAIYSKVSNESHWFRSTMVIDTFTTVSAYRNGDSLFANGNSAKFLIIGQDSLRTSPFDTANAITLKDLTQPRIYGQYGMTLSGFSNTYSLTPKVIPITINLYPSSSSYSSYRAEPLDTTAGLSISVREGKRSYTSYTGDSTYAVSQPGWRWTSRNSGILSATVDGGKDGTNDTLILDFRALTDMAKNPVDTAFASGLIKLVTR